MPRVSVIIPCYNYGKYINEAVESVLNQTFQDFEIIIVNDGSTDEYTNSLLKGYSHPKVKVIQIENMGPSSARNIGIKKAKGEYILPLDADDKIGITYLEKGVEILDKNDDIGIVYCKAELFGNKKGQWALPEYTFETMLLFNMIFNSAFYRKKDWKRVRGYNPNMIFSLEDYDFWLSLIEIGVSVYRIPEVLFYYRIKEVSRSTISAKYTTEMLVQIFYNHQNLYINNIHVLINNRVSPKHSAHIFVDTGNGYNGQEMIELKNFNSFMNIFEFRFDLSTFNSILSIRFDPVEGRWCKVKITEIIYEVGGVGLLSVDCNNLNSNGVKQEDGYVLFHTFDPMFFIPINGNIKSVEISGYIEFFDTHYIDDILSIKQKIIDQQAELIKHLESCLKD